MELAILERQCFEHAPPGGAAYHTWERVTMPHIPDCVADCAIYLYVSDRAARDGQDAGGSGFLTHIPSSADPHARHIYAVTNRHLVDGSRDGNFWTIRMTRRGGGTDTIQTKKDDWFLHDSGDDVAIYPITFDPNAFKWWSVPRDMFLDEEAMTAYKIGYGDDVFMVGRLISQSGKEKNTPVARFGTLALPPDKNEPIKHDGREDEAFLIECHSISGFSGSPVFFMSDRMYHGEEEREKMAYWQKKHAVTPDPRFTPDFSQGTVGPFLLGIDFGHIRSEIEVYKKLPRGAKGSTDYRVKENTSIAGVVPVWKLAELLDTPRLIEDRVKEDGELKTKLEKSNDSFVLDR
jgi:hypothetical protein